MPVRTKRLGHTVELCQCQIVRYGVACGHEYPSGGSNVPRSVIFYSSIIPLFISVMYQGLTKLPSTFFLQNNCFLLLYCTHYFIRTINMKHTVSLLFLCYYCFIKFITPRHTHTHSVSLVIWSFWCSVFFFYDSFFYKRFLECSYFQTQSYKIIKFYWIL